MPTLDKWLTKRVVMPRWAIGLDFLWRVFLAVGAITVIILWYQAATRDEETDRNARIQSCSSGYAAISAAWDARALKLEQESETLDRHAETLFSRIVARADADEALGGLVGRYENAQERAESRTQDAVAAAERVEEMTRRRIGLAVFSVASVEKGNAFDCPPLPDDLMVDPIYPRGFTPPD